MAERWAKYLVAATALISAPAMADSSLLYYEAQGVAGYSSVAGKVVYNSNSMEDVMQKSSVGFDYLTRILSSGGDAGAAALQMRVAYDEHDKKMELQVYNAYIKGKTNYGDIWVGHNRVAYGLSAYWDTHGALLQPLAMYGFGYDRDWGAGYSIDTADGNFQAAVSTGTGMNVRGYGNGIFTARASKGVLAVDNFTIGASYMGGSYLDTMGNQIMDRDPKSVSMAAFDIAYNYNNIEHKAEIDVGQKNGRKASAALYRFGINLLEEEQLKLEGQSVFTKSEGDSDYSYGGGASYKINSDLTSRFMYEHKGDDNDNRFIVQFYYYFK